MPTAHAHLHNRPKPGVMPGKVKPSELIASLAKMYMWTTHHAAKAQVSKEYMATA